MFYSRLDCSSVRATMLRITLVGRLTWYSWNAACNTRCLQGFEEVRGRVLQCNYYVMKGWCRSSYGERQPRLRIQSKYVIYVRSYRAKFLQPFASARFYDDHKFDLFSLGIDCDLSARDLIVKNNKYEEKYGNGTTR